MGLKEVAEFEAQKKELEDLLPMSIGTQAETSLRRKIKWVDEQIAAEKQVA
ncbi:hypothetical protein DLP3_115 [Stenotrophomonas phage vB_SmaS_DLP_3]|nr:hypothetical protein DLP3_115 [Stenotrophomonas phage vB_SmaS_DLP_3]